MRGAAGGGGGGSSGGGGAGKEEHSRALPQPYTLHTVLDYIIYVHDVHRIPSYHRTSCTHRT